MKKRGQIATMWAIFGMVMAAFVILASSAMLLKYAAILIGTPQEEQAARNHFTFLTDKATELVAAEGIFAADVINEFHIPPGFIIVGFDTDWHGDSDQNTNSENPLNGKIEANWCSDGEGMTKPVQCLGKACLCLYKDTAGDDFMEEGRNPDAIVAGASCVTFDGDVVISGPRDSASDLWYDGALTGRRENNGLNDGAKKYLGIPDYYPGPGYEFLVLYGDCDGAWKIRNLYLEKFVDTKTQKIYLFAADEKEIRNRKEVMRKKYGIPSAEEYLNQIEVIFKTIGFNFAADQSKLLKSYEELRKEYPSFEIPEDLLIFVGMNYYDVHSQTFPPNNTIAEKYKKIFQTYLDKNIVTKPLTFQQHRTLYYLAESIFLTPVLNEIRPDKKKISAEDIERSNQAFALYTDLIEKGDKASDYWRLAHYDKAMIRAYFCNSENLAPCREASQLMTTFIEVENVKQGLNDAKERQELEKIKNSAASKNAINSIIRGFDFGLVENANKEFNSVFKDLFDQYTSDLIEKSQSIITSDLIALGDEDIELMISQIESQEEMFVLTDDSYKMVAVSYYGRFAIYDSLCGGFPQPEAVIPVEDSSVFDEDDCKAKLDQYKADLKKWDQRIIDSLQDRAEHKSLISLAKIDLQLIEKPVEGIDSSWFDYKAPDDFRFLSHIK